MLLLYPTTKIIQCKVHKVRNWCTFRTLIENRKNNSSDLNDCYKTRSRIITLKSFSDISHKTCNPQRPISKTYYYDARKRESTKSYPQSFR